MESVESEAVSVDVEEVVIECLHEEKELVKELNTLTCVLIQEKLCDEVVEIEVREAAQKVVLESLEVKSVKDRVANVAVTATIDDVLMEEVQEIVQNVYL